MSGRDLPERLLRARLADHAREADRAAIETLRARLLEINRLAAEAEQLARAFPALRIDPVLLAGGVRGAVGMAWHQSELAEAQL